jgi:hypothetical protein
MRPRLKTCHIGEKRAEMEKARRQGAESHQGEQPVSHDLKESTGAVQVSMHASTNCPLSPGVEPKTGTAAVGDALELSEDSYPNYFALDSPEIVTGYHDLTHINTLNGMVSLQRSEYGSSHEMAPFDRKIRKGPVAYLTTKRLR